MRYLEKNIKFCVHRMRAGVMEAAVIFSVFLYKLEDIVPLYTLITTSRNDSSVVEHSCVTLMFVIVLLAWSRKVVNVSI